MTSTRLKKVYYYYLLLLLLFIMYKNGEIGIYIKITLGMKGFYLV
jgi:hypothetical protein